MVRQGYGESRKALIFDALTELLLDEGIGAVTFAKISERCHLHINTIAYYFNGKDDMLIQCYRHILARERAQLPEFYYRVPAGMTPAEGLSRLVDHLLDNSRHMSPARRLLNIYLNSSLNLSPQIRDALLEIQRTVWEEDFQAIMVYRDAGILAEDRIRQGYAEIDFTSSGYCLVNYFHSYCPDAELALERARERIKETLMTEDVYRSWRAQSAGHDV